MITPGPTRRHRRYPHERGLGREQRRAAARELLRRYLRQVTHALNQHGFEVIRTHLGGSDDLEAVLTVHPSDPARHGLPPVLELSWAEDTGWAVSHHLISATATPWRYLHTELVPTPTTVARFLTVVAEDGDGEVGMLYPAQFRFRGQPLQPVLDELARHTETDQSRAPGQPPPAPEGPLPGPDGRARGRRSG